MRQEKDSKLAFDWMGFRTLSLALGPLQMMLDPRRTAGLVSSVEVVIEAVGRLGSYLFRCIFSPRKVSLHRTADVQ